MARMLAALLVLQTFPLPAFAQTLRAVPGVRTAPALVAPLAPMAALPLAPGLALTPASPAPLAPALAFAPVPAAAAATPAPAARPGAAPALEAIRAAGAAAAAAAAKPSSMEGDRARLNFADGAAARAEAVEAVPAAFAVAPPLAALAARAPAAEPAAARPLPPSPARPRLAPFLAGTFLAQLASNALQVTMPLLVLAVTASPATAAFAATASSAVDAGGTLLGGRLVDRLGAKRVLIATSVLRGAAVAVLPALALTTGLALPAVLAAYMLESLARGVADTARNTVPSELAGRDEPLLKKVLAKNQAYFEAGSLAGPLIAGALIAVAGGVSGAAALWLAPAAFAGTALAYLGLSRSPARAPVASAEAPAPAVRPVLDGWMKWALGATALLTLYPLKGVLPAIFADQVLGDPASAAWLVAAFGAGGLLGSLAYGRLAGRAGLKSWLAAGAAGTALLGLAFLPGAFVPAAAGVIVFAAANSAARLALNAAIQSRAPEGRAGAAVGAARFTANLSSLGVRLLAGLAFAAALAPAQAFWLVAGGVFAAAGLQLWASRRLAALTAAGAAAALSPFHGLPGRLLVVEGLDGSGKSTQMELLKEELEGRGLEVVVTTWNSSEVVSDAVKRAKKEQALTPRTFSLLHASDLADRLDKVILPALREGKIVLADRWFFTAFARDRVRGNEADWLRRLYSFAPRPDLVLYYKLPVETAIGRVLARNEGRLGLSEDSGPGLKYYEAGLDAKLAADPVENFRLFQSRVVAEYDAQAAEFGFKVLDSARTREEIRADTFAAAFGALGALSAFKRREAPRPLANLFDKDPAGDAENIRRNYMHEKRGVHFYFRNMLLPMQERFAELMDMASAPRVFLHGSPHIDNYAKSNQGAAMADFDRSRVGPYHWDLLRLMASLSLRAKKEPRGLLDKEVLKQLKKGYLRGLRHPDRPFSEYRELKDKEPEDDERTTNAYLAANKKWAREMRSDPVAADHPAVVELVNGWAAARGDGLLNDYAVEEAGRGQGSMGFREIYLVVLAPKDARSGKDRILLNFKATRTDPDTEWYKNPRASEGERMKAASDLYAPGWEGLSGPTRLGGVEYYARQIDPMNAKIKKALSVEQQADFAYSVGTQLGRAHRLSLEGATPEELEAHLDDNFAALAEAGLVIKNEIIEAHARYLAKMKRDGLEPGPEDEE